MLAAKLTCHVNEQEIPIQTHLIQKNTVI